MDTTKLRRYKQATGELSQRLACHYKRSYPSAAKARKYARTMAGRYGRQQAYQCPLCGQWHLTSRQ